MRDIGTTLRTAYFLALNGQIMYEAAVIPVVDEKLDDNITTQDLFILVGAQNENDSSNKTRWANETQLVITIINRRKATNSKVAVESISDQILSILFPTKTDTGLTVPAPFSLTYARLLSSEYSFLKLDNGWQISKTLTFKNRITQ